MDTLPAQTDDAALLRAFADGGDRQAMNVLFARHADAAYRVALRCSRHGADAEDAVQTAFIEVLRHAAEYRGESAVRSWIFGFVVNACRHKAREEARRSAREQRSAVSREPEAPDGAVQEALRHAVRALPEHVRLPVWLHYCEGLSSPEVADALSLPQNTVRSQLSRGIEELRSALAASGLSMTAMALVGALAAAAVESAPASLTASFSGLAPGAALKAGIVAKVAAATMAALTVASTAAALWWGQIPEDVRPPEFSKIDERVREWQPTPEERRFDEVGWAKGLPEALRLSREHDRPVFVLGHVGRLNTGRSDGGSMSFRGGPLSDPRVIAALNARFVPVYVNTEDRSNQEMRRVARDARQAGLESGTEFLYILEARTGRVVDSFHVCALKTEEFLAKLQRHAPEGTGPTLQPPAPQSQPPASAGLVLHVTSRYLDVQGRLEKGMRDYHAFPAEEWMALSPSDEAALVPSDPALGSSWDVDLAVAGRLLARLYPLTGNQGPPEGNVLRSAGLSAKVVGGRADRAWIRLSGHVQLEHPFFAGKDPRPADAAVRGYIEYDRAERRIRTFRLISDQAVYGRENFAVAMRSVP